MNIVTNFLPGLDLVMKLLALCCAGVAVLQIMTKQRQAFLPGIYGQTQASLLGPPLLLHRLLPFVLCL